MLPGAGTDGVWFARIPDHGVAAQSDPAHRRHDPAAPIAIHIAARGDRNRQGGGEVIGNHDVGSARIMDVYQQDHRRVLRALVDQFVTGPDLHADSIVTYSHPDRPAALVV